MCKVFVTNASSLFPKIGSLVDAFGSLNLHFACITKTWYSGGRELRDHIGEVEGRTGIRILQKSRDGRVRKRGGGVALAFNTALCNFKQRQLKIMTKEHEVMCAVGKVGKIERKVVVFVIYIPPAIKARQLEELREALAVEVTAVKADIKNPVLIMAGDLNHHVMAGAVNLTEQITLIPSGPTRVHHTIDLIYTNAPHSITECLTLPPLETASGAKSNHKCVYVVAEFEARKNFEWVVKMRRLRNNEREEAFEADLRGLDWGSLPEKDVNTIWDTVEDVIAKLTNKHFPLVRVRKRSNESPRITRGVRRMWKKKIRIYKKEGKGQAWWDTDRALHKRIGASRNEFMEKMLLEGNSGRSFYAATKELAKATVVPQWLVKDLFVGRRPQEICQDVLNYFGKVAEGPAPDLSEEERCLGGLGYFSHTRTEALLKAVKRLDSRVNGDPLPHLVRCHPNAFTAPIFVIFNKVNQSGVWPSKWKTEHLTVIPKNPNPSDLSECRNISCTSIFSKVLEGEVQAQLRRELTPDPNQYGRITKCSVKHMLVNLWKGFGGPLRGAQTQGCYLGSTTKKRSTG